ncbi:hypothetical protein [Bdellovibrio bacteriovorus]|uniref:bestrophin-like domain n=1 Tax=Bdellovibrio TaxID=958 RepID=UPI0035A836A4
MFTEFLYKIDLIYIFLANLAVLVAATLVFYFFGKSRHHKERNVINEILPTSILGLLALLLGFTFSMSISRFDNRKHLVLKEANSIGTAYLRTDLLPSPQREQVKTLLQEYTAHRLTFFQNIRTNTADYQKKSQDLQTQIWKTAVDVSGSLQGPVTSLVIQSLNDVIDTDGERVFATYDHVPEVVYYVIMLITLLGVGSLSYVVGAKGQRMLAPLFLSVLFALVIGLIQDLDRPGRGMIQIGEESLIQLQQSFK